MKNDNRLSGYSFIVKAGRDRRGSILVFLIILMATFTVLGVGIVSMFGTSVPRSSFSNNARRAGYLAESGLRYTISEVRNAAAAAREAALTAIGPRQQRQRKVVQRVSRPGPRLSLLERTAAHRSPRTPSAQWRPIPGSAGLCHPNGPRRGLRRPTSGRSVPRRSAASRAPRGDPGSHLHPGLQRDDPRRCDAFANLAFPTTNASQIVTKGSAATPLVLNINDVTAIPEKNGEFMDATSGRLYAYGTARLVGADVELENITWSAAAATVTFNPRASRTIIWSFRRRPGLSPRGNSSRQRSRPITSPSSAPPPPWAGRRRSAGRKI